MSDNGKRSNTGVFFLLMGIVSAVILTWVLYAKYDSEDFFYITSYENGIKTTEYSPGFVIGMFVFMYVFAAAFIWLGIYMIRKGRESIVMSLGEVMVIEKDQHKDEHAVGHATERPGDNIHSASFRYSSVVSGGQRTVIEHGNKNVTILMSRLFTGIGALVIAIGITMLVWDRTSLQSLIKTEADVVSIYTHRGTYQKRSKTYYAKIKYDIDGKHYVSRVTVSAFFHDSHVTVYCDPANPLICRTNNEYLFWYIILFSVGIGFVVISTVFRYVIRNKINTETSSE